MKTSITFSVPIIIEKDNGEFHAFCPALKGLHTRGDTEKEVLNNAEDAIIAYLMSLIKYGDPIPLGIQMPTRKPRLKRLFGFGRHPYIYKEIEVTP